MAAKSIQGGDGRSIQQDSGQLSFPSQACTQRKRQLLAMTEGLQAAFWGAAGLGVREAALR